jgi:hypothetical protein
VSDINYLAVLVAVIAAFILSTVWYTVFGAQRAALLASASGSAQPTAGQRPPPWQLLAELARTAILALAIAWIGQQLDLDGFGQAVGLAVVVWVGFPFVLLSGSVMWDNVDWRLATIHGGDWFIKILLVCLLVGLWH